MAGRQFTERLRVVRRLHDGLPLIGGTFLVVQHSHRLTAWPHVLKIQGDWHLTMFLEEGDEVSLEAHGHYATQAGCGSSILTWPL